MKVAPLADKCQREWDITNGFRSLEHQIAISDINRIAADDRPIYNLLQRDRMAETIALAGAESPGVEVLLDLVCNRALGDLPQSSIAVGPPWDC
jgi:hypothetical protein